MRAAWVVALLTPPGLTAVGVFGYWSVPSRPAPGIFDTTHPDSEQNQSELQTAEQHFARGVELRGDASQAKREFATAADGFDRLWNRGFQTAPLALNRARAHRLAGDLPHSILALHEGLAVTPSNRSLQDALADARSAVAYPIGSEAKFRPEPSFTIGSRMSPQEAFILAGSVWLVACLAATRFLMTRNALWLWFAGSCVAGLIALGVLWWQDSQLRQADASHPWAIVAEDVVLRKGNALSYPPTIEPRLPKGVEVRVLGERGGWLHVELASGTAGWLPAPAVLR